MESDLEDSQSVKELVTSAQRMKWVVTGFTVLCAAIVVAISFLDVSGGGSYAFITLLCVFIGFCFEKVHELAQVVERLVEKGKGKTD